MTMSNQEISAHWWCNGLCSVFAAALQQMYGGEIFAILDHSRKFNDDFLVHCYVVIDGVAWDSNGAHSLVEVSDTSGYEPTLMDQDNDVIFVWRKITVEYLQQIHSDCDLELIPCALSIIAQSNMFGSLQEKTRL